MKERIQESGYYCSKLWPAAVIRIPAMWGAAMNKIYMNQLYSMAMTKSKM